MDLPDHAVPLPSDVGGGGGGGEPTLPQNLNLDVVKF